MNDYLFNLFLSVSTPVGLVILAVLIICYVAMPISKKFIPLEYKDRILEYYGTVKSAVISVGFLLVVSIVALSALSPTITPKNVTYDVHAEKRQLLESNRNSYNENDTISTEGVRSWMPADQLTSDEYKDLTNWKEPMYSNDDSENKKVETND
tara:strand:+ start:35 stop:493 length:459 start_codon:yes stop_codon:yes gene_type:complete